MTTCGSYIAPAQFQLTPRTPTSGDDCTAYSAAIVIDAATCGAKRPTGRQIRLASNEPIPDPASPGLNLGQVAAVAAKYGVTLDVRLGSRAIAWSDYEARRLAGEPVILQLGYGPIADSRYDAGRGFRGGHAIAETVHATYDPLADGRPGAWRFDGTVYDRDVIRRAAASLSLGTRAGQPVYPPAGFVWAAFGPDVVPSYRIVIHPLPGQRYRAFNTYTIRNGLIVAPTGSARTAGMSAGCTPPLLIPDRRPGRTGSRYVVRITSGARAGQWVSAAWSVTGP